MRFIIRGTAVAMAAVVLGASADARTIYHCNQATQHCVNGSLPYNVVTNPPSAADRRGLLKAFGRAIQTAPIWRSSASVSTHHTRPPATT